MVENLIPVPTFFADVAVDDAASPSVISLNIKYSKMDTGRAGYQVVLGNTRDLLGRSSPSLLGFMG